MQRIWGFILIFYGCWVALFFWGYQNKKQFNYPSRVLFKSFGLDVSHHQGHVDWSKVRRYDFVYIKATEGESFQDKRFFQNYANASKYGLKVGAYHFYHPCKDSVRQFQNLIRAFPPQKGNMIPALDIESLGGGCQGKTPAEITAKLQVDMRTLNQKFKVHYGKLPLIYTTEEFSQKYPVVLSWPNAYWLRSLIGPPLWRKNTKWSVWQYYNNGKVTGFQGGVDLNVIRTEKVLEELVQ